MFSRFLLMVALTASLSVWSAHTYSLDVTFVDVAQDQGITYSGPSFGASWGDFDRDGHPDLYLSNHAFPTSIYRNSGSGFVDVSASATGFLSGDLHGGAWGDFDNDGDQDLAIAVGASFGIGAGPNRMLKRTSSGFVDIADELGLELGLGRGRTPLWFDWNNDGLLDIVFTNSPRLDGIAPTALFTQMNGIFIDSNASVGLMPTGFMSYSTLYAPGPIEPALLLIHNSNQFPGAVYDYASAPFVDVQGALALSAPSPVNDSSLGDFDNDQQTEIFLTRVSDTMVVRAITTHQARAFLKGEVDTDYGFSFAAPGEISVSVGLPSQIASTDIKIGSVGIEPPNIDFDLDSTDPTSWGEFAGNIATTGLFVHYDPVAELWFIRLKLATSIGIVIDSVSALENLESIGIPDDPAERQAVYLDKVGSTFVNNAVTAGLGELRACPASASADFDNDMDLDIYLVCSDVVGNFPNVMLENDGSGFFTSVVGAAGAVGATGGVGEAVALADFDSDGFVDILVTNGKSGPPLALDGPTQLYRNEGNANHWLEIDLRGAQSNADAVGARVIVETGSVTQYRMQNGGMHRFSQDHTRLHFGLANNTTVDRIEVRWPSGLVQEFENQASDQVLVIAEPIIGDSDEDSIDDVADNCVLIPNTDQRDSNGDGHGNLCDFDYNNDCSTNFADLSLFMGAFFSTTGDANYDEDLDLDGSGSINFLDFGFSPGGFASFFTNPPGPSATPCTPTS